MKTLLTFLVFYISLLNLSGQDYWSKSYDPFDLEQEKVINLIQEDSTLFVSAEGTCLENSVWCHKLLKFDLEGNLIDGFENENFVSGSGMEIDENYIYIAGNDSESNSYLSIQRIRKDFSETQSVSASVPNANTFVSQSCISNDKHIIVHGAYLTGFSQSPSSSRKGMQVWVDKVSFTIDTIITFEPSISSIDIVGMSKDSEGFLYSVAIDEQRNIHGQVLKFHRFFKQDLMGNVLWDFTYTNKYHTVDGNFVDNLEDIGKIVVNEGRIFFLVFDEIRQPFLVCLDKFGNQLWEHEFEHDFKREVRTLSLKIKSNNNLLIAGYQTSLKYHWLNVGFISEVNKDSGNLVWERVFEVDKGEDAIYGGEYPRKSYFIAIEESSNGNIYLGGIIKHDILHPIFGLTHNDDLWLVYLDNKGCLIEDCGYLQELYDGVVLTDSCKWLINNAKWCYSQWSLNPNQDLAQIEIIGDTLIGNRLCSVMGLYNEDVFVEGSQLICFYEEENEFVYFYEDEEFKLLYDFSFSVLPGDTVEYFLPTNFNLYDISSGQGYADPSGNSYKYRYLEPEWIQLENGEWLRIMQTMPIPNENGECFEMGRIIDGVGSDRGFLGKNCPSLPSGFSSFFRNYESVDLTYAEAEGCIVTSVNSVNLSSVKVFPNPTSDVLRIQSVENEIVRVRLFSTLGHKVLHQEIKNMETNISTKEIAPGIYWLDIGFQDGSSYTEKILKVVE